MAFFKVAKAGPGLNARIKKLQKTKLMISKDTVCIEFCDQLEYPPGIRATVNQVTDKNEPVMSTAIIQKIKKGPEFV